MSLLDWLFGPKPPVRTAFLERWDGTVTLVKVEESGSGWACKVWAWDNSVYRCRDVWIILRPDGTTCGHSQIVRWHPHRGWEKDEGDADD